MGEKPKVETLPALDSEDLRKLNTQKIVDSVESMGDFFKDIKKTSKYSLYVNIGMTLLLIFVLLGAYVFGIVNGGIDSVYDREEARRRFNCTSGGIQDTIRNYEDADMFVKLYNGTCQLYKV